ncbi:MAG: hypothetical protein HQL35_04555 [Alphaproteobacteria bacterium]|nr:hypothetical protein [Alphaproteobacteria bacterium]
MAQSPTITQRLTFRILAPVVVFVTALVVMLMFVFNALLDDFVRQEAAKEMDSRAREIFVQCDVKLNDLLRKGRGGNAAAVRITKVKTAAMVSDILRANHMDGLIVGQGREILRTDHFPRADDARLPGLAGGVLFNSADGAHFLYRFAFEPWDWDIYFAKHRGDYETVGARLRNVYLLVGAFIALGAGVLLIFLKRGIHRPVERIIDSLNHEDAPNYTGIYEFEYLSQHISEIMDDLKAAIADATKASRAKSDFLSSMSHELRTPMNAVLGFAQLLELDDLDDNQRMAVEQILKSGRHLLDLIDQVLELEKIEAGKIDMEVTDVAVRDLMRDCVDMVRVRAQDLGIQLFDRCGESGCGQMIRTDARRMTQALVNLLSNAVKYNRPGGSVTLGCALRPDGAVRVSVSDTGLGIPADRRDKLFVPFERLGHESGAIEGTGIGLTITRQIVHMMGGEIGFDSAEGQGSTFWIDMPPANASR